MRGPDEPRELRPIDKDRLREAEFITPNRAGRRVRRVHRAPKVEHHGSRHEAGALMHEDILHWPAIDVFYTSQEPTDQGESPRVWCTRVHAPFESIPKIAEHYKWRVIGMVVV